MHALYTSSTCTDIQRVCVNVYIGVATVPGQLTRGPAPAIWKVDMAEIRQEIIEWNNNMRNTKTAKNYSVYQRQYLEYCKGNHFPSTEPSPEILCKFLLQNYTSGKWTSASTFNQARSAIADMFRYTHKAQLGEEPLVQTTINNIAANLPEPKQKKPLTTDIIQKICASLDLAKFSQVRDYYMILLMMATYMRESEIVKLEINKVRVVSLPDGTRGMEIIHVPAKKRVKAEQRKYVAAAPNNGALDVLTWHNLYMSRCVHNAVYLFHSQTGEGLSSTTPFHALKRLFTQAGLDFTGYGSHSARRGGATAALADGAHQALIKQQGSWTSSAVDRYLSPDPKTLFQATAFLNRK